MHVKPANSKRTPLALGWEAARANALPGFILQAMMLALLVAYYVSPATSSALNQIADYKKQHGLMFVVFGAVAAGAMLPELFVIFFFQRGRVHAQNFRNLAFTIPTWGIDGILVDLMYRSMAAWLGDVVTWPVVLTKICVDQVRLQSIHRRAGRGFGLRMEEHAHFVGVGAARADLGALSR